MWKFFFYLLCVIMNNQFALLKTRRTLLLSGVATQHFSISKLNLLLIFPGELCFVYCVEEKENIKKQKNKNWNAYFFLFHKTCDFMNISQMYFLYDKQKEKLIFLFYFQRSICKKKLSDMDILFNNNISLCNNCMT